MAYIKIVIWLTVILLSSCASLPNNKQEQKKNHKDKMMDAYLDSSAQGSKDSKKYIDQILTERNTFGYVKPYIPIVKPAEVRKVWIPDKQSEEDAQVLIAGHWIYVMIQGSQWTLDGMDQKMPSQEIIPKVPLLDQQGDDHER